VLGIAFIAGAWQLRRNPEPSRAIRFFGYSNLYLASLFVVVAVDTLIRAA
jgi:heme O synthase-like polyprenyltransferase